MLNQTNWLPAPSIHIVYLMLAYKSGINLLTQLKLISLSIKLFLQCHFLHLYQLQDHKKRYVVPSCMPEGGLTHCVTNTEISDDEIGTDVFVSSWIGQIPIKSFKHDLLVHPADALEVMWSIQWLWHQKYRQPKRSIYTVFDQSWVCMRFKFFQLL